MKPTAIAAGLVLIAIGAGAYWALTGTHRHAASLGYGDEESAITPAESDRAEPVAEAASAYSAGEIPPALAKTIHDAQTSADPRGSVWAGVLLVSWSDFESGVAAIRRQYTVSEVEAKIAQLFGIIHEHTLDGFGAHLEFIKHEREQGTVAGAVARSWAQRDPAAVGLIAAQLTGSLKTAVAAEAIRVLAESDEYSKAAQLVHMLPPSSEKSVMLQQLASRLGKAQPGIALQWLRSLDSEDDRRAVESGILSASGFTREELAALANASADPAGGARAMNSVADRMIANDVQQAMQWATQAPAQYRPEIQQKIAIKLAETDFARGTAYALTIEDTSARDASLDAINSELVSRNPDTAVDWLQTLPAESQQRAAFHTVSLWYDLDSAQVSRWIDTLDAGDLKDHALLALSSRLAQTNLDAARDAARQIADPDLRTSALDDL